MKFQKNEIRLSKGYTNLDEMWTDLKKKIHKLVIKKLCNMLFDNLIFHNKYKGCCLIRQYTIWNIIFAFNI